MSIRVHYMGDNMFLLSSVGETQVRTFVEENNECLSNFFESIEPWNVNCIPGNCIVLLRCTGMSLNVWNDDGLGKLIAGFETLVSVTEETLELINVQYARAMIRTSKVFLINKFMKIKINRRYKSG